MQRFRKILVGVDGSDAGFHALSEAVRLAQWSKGSITAVHVIPSHDGDLNLVGVGDIQSLITGPCEVVLDQALKVARRLHFKVDIRCEMGNPEERITALSAERGHDLLVLGSTRGPSASGFLRALLTMDMIRLIRTALLVVPAHAPIGWEKILLICRTFGALDRDLANGADLAALYGGHLHVCCLERLADADIACRDFAARGLPQAPITSVRVPTAGARKALTRYILQQKIQMVIMAGDLPGRCAWRIGSDPLKELVRTSPCPLLVLPSGMASGGNPH